MITSSLFTFSHPPPSPALMLLPSSLSPPYIISTHPPLLLSYSPALIIIPFPHLFPVFLLLSPPFPLLFRPLLTFPFFLLPHVCSHLYLFYLHSHLVPTPFFPPFFLSSFLPSLLPSSPIHLLAINPPRPPTPFPNLLLTHLTYFQYSRFYDVTIALFFIAIDQFIELVNKFLNKYSCCELLIHSWGASIGICHRDIRYKDIAAAVACMVFLTEHNVYI